MPLIYAMMLFSTMTAQVIYDFSKDSKAEDWIIVDDVVMGGRSAGRFSISADGFGVFEGAISLENYGGFSSVRYRFPQMQTEGATKAIIRLKGDGKNYQFRLKARVSDYYSYIARFSTTGEWQEIIIPLEEMYPAFRGRRLNQANFSESHIEEVAFLIGNKKEENFKLLLDKIVLQ